MTTSFFRSGDLCIAVETGMPEQAIRIGMGVRPRAALADLQATPIQSAGRDAAERALRWAARQWDRGCDPERVEAINVTDADLDDTMSAWED